MTVAAVAAAVAGDGIVLHAHQQHADLEVLRVYGAVPL